MSGIGDKYVYVSSWGDEQLLGKTDGPETFHRWRVTLNFPQRHDFSEDKEPDMVLYVEAPDDISIEGVLRIGTLISDGY